MPEEEIFKVVYLQDGSVNNYYFLNKSSFFTETYPELFLGAYLKISQIIEICKKYNISFWEDEKMEENFLKEDGNYLKLFFMAEKRISLSAVCMNKISIKRGIEIVNLFLNALPVCHYDWGTNETVSGRIKTEEDASEAGIGFDTPEEQEEFREDDEETS